MKKNTHRINIPMFIACVLFCLTLFSIHLTGGLYAKYVVRDSASDEARVAVMATDITMQLLGDTPVQLVGVSNVPTYPGDKETIHVEVTNYTDAAVCEVALSYAFSVAALEDNIPYVITIFEDSACTIPATSLTGSFAPSVKQSEEYWVKVEWPANYNDAHYAFEIDVIQLEIQVEQID